MHGLLEQKNECKRKNDPIQELSTRKIKIIGDWRVINLNLGEQVVLVYGNSKHIFF